MNLFRSAPLLPHESFRVIKQDRFYAIIPIAMQLQSCGSLGNSGMTEFRFRQESFYKDDRTNSGNQREEFQFHREQ